MEPAANEKILRVVEFYSGIGGMHWALKLSGFPFEVVAAIDINTTANQIYAHNFPETKILQNNIEALSIEKLDILSGDLWTMSPPCQPFTHKGLQLGAEDRRSDSFREVLKKLTEMSRPPRYIFIENVVGFENSSVHDELLTCLCLLGYEFKEYILSPMQFGVPNTRPRYYCLAERTLLESRSRKESQVLTTHPESTDSIERIENFLETDLETSSLVLEDNIRTRFANSMDVIAPNSRRSACFTKSYGRYKTGCGSFFIEDDKMINGNRLLTSNEPVPVRLLSTREVANLMCFPKDFKWPVTMKDTQIYRTLGNSVNVLVVKILLCDLLSRFL